MEMHTLILDTHTVKNLDIERYMGKWYEISRYDHDFEKGLSHVSTEYTLKDGKNIEIVNRGIKEDGIAKVIKGKGRIPDINDPGKLQISFFLWFYSNYYILEVDDKNYEYAMVGSNTNKYLWILSRTPILPETIRLMLLNKANWRGYDIGKLIWVNQE